MGALNLMHPFLLKEGDVMEEYIEIAKVIFEAYTRISYDGRKTNHKICVQEMAKCHKNREHNEGLTSMSASGISESYESLYPKYIITMLNSLKKKVRLL